jgi:hypothetical protein
MGVVVTASPPSSSAPQARGRSTSQPAHGVARGMSCLRSVAMVERWTPNAAAIRLGASGAARQRPCRLEPLAVTRGRSSILPCAAGVRADTLGVISVQSIAFNAAAPLTPRGRGRAHARRSPP